MKNRINYDIVFGFIIILFSTFFIVQDNINHASTYPLLYDECYNATVAANLVRYGEYRVSYPSNIIFYNLITTGVAMLLPTSFVYNFFGINTVTSSIIPILYGSICLFLIWLLLGMTLSANYKNYINYTLSALLTILLVLSDNFYKHCSTRLLGEIAALFFTLLSFLFLLKYFQHRNYKNIFFSGAMIACSFLTKSAMIVFVISLSGLILIEMFFLKNINHKDGIKFFIGFFAGFILLDLYKFIQLGGEIEKYFMWWIINEAKNMIEQSSALWINHTIGRKFDYLLEIFSSGNKYFWSILISSILIYYTHKTFIQKNTIKNHSLHTILIYGICASSLLVYFVFLGGDGLIYARRHFVYEFILRICGCYFLGALILSFYNNRKYHSVLNQRKYVQILKITIIGILFIFMFPYKVVRNNLKKYWNKEKHATYSLQIMENFLKEVNELPYTAQLYCAGWWQEPNITLFLDRDLRDIYEAKQKSYTLTKESYFIVGHFIHKINITDVETFLNAKLVKIDTIQINYNRYNQPFDRRDFDLFSIYKIIVVR